MHFKTLVLIPHTEDVDAAVDRAMAPFNEETNESGWWDWFQIGGRWTGVLSGYDPSSDPENIETCFICNGTGTRTDATGVSMNMHKDKRCNGCNPDGASAVPGKRTKWPTEFARHSGDILPARYLTDDQITNFYRVVTGSAETIHCEEFDGENFVANADYNQSAIAAVRAHNGLAVVVDCHS